MKPAINSKKATNSTDTLSAACSCAFDFIGVAAVIYSNEQWMIDHLAGLYEKFIIDTVPDDHITCYIISRGKDCSETLLVTGNTSYTLKGEEAFDWAEMLIFQEVMKMTGKHFIAHAGVAARGDTAVVVYAPSGFGKTTLITKLVSRGYDFLSDEYCPVHIDDHHIEPFPRRIGLKKTSPFYDKKNRRGVYLRHEDKIFYHVNDIVTCSIGQRCTAGKMIFLNDRMSAEPARRDRDETYNLLLLNDTAGIESILHESAHIDVKKKADELFFTRYVLGVSDKMHFSGILNKLYDRYADDIFCIGKVALEKPDFSEKPCIQPIKKSDAGIDILLQLLNRSRSCRVMSNFGHKLTGAYAAILNILRTVDCYEMKPGNLDAMVDMIEGV